MCNIGRGHYKEHCCEIVLNMVLWLRRCHCVLNIGRGHYEKYFCENIYNFGPVVKEDILFKDSSICSSGGHFVQLSRTVCAILVVDIMGNNPVKSF